MATLDLVFEVVSTNTTIYDPVSLTDGLAIDFRVTNTGSTVLTDLGLYVVPATSVGDVDAAAEAPPESDYEDMLTWGEIAGGPPYAGLTVTLPQNVGPDVTTRVSHSAGAAYASRIAFKDLGIGEAAEFQVEFNSPGGSARRFYIDLVLE